MQAEVEQLLVIQDRDKKIRALEQELAQIPQERKRFEDKVAGTAARFDAVKVRSREIEVERKDLEVQADGKRASIAKFKTQQFETRKNEEYQALSNEIARFEKQIEEIEDREIELMESSEKLKPDIAEADREAKAARDLIDRQMADIDAKKKAIEEQLTKLKDERAGLAAAVDEDLLGRYERIFKSKGEAVVALEHVVCMGCHMKITTQTAVRVKGRHEIVHCDQCGRILYPGE